MALCLVNHRKGSDGQIKIARPTEKQKVLSPLWNLRHCLPSDYSCTCYRPIQISIVFYSRVCRNYPFFFLKERRGSRNRTRDLSTKSGPQLIGLLSWLLLNSYVYCDQCCHLDFDILFKEPLFSKYFFQDIQNINATPFSTVI